MNAALRLDLHAFSTHTNYLLPTQIIINAVLCFFIVNISLSYYFCLILLDQFICYLILMTTLTLDFTLSSFYIHYFVAFP